MPFTVYVDDSGTDPKQHVACATGLIIPASKIVRMESEWAELKKKEGFSDFHTSEFVARNKKSEFANWTDEKRERVFSRVRQITKKYTVQIISFAINKIDYESIVPLEIRRHVGIYHYSWAVRHVLSFAERWRTYNRVSSEYEWVFDWMERRDVARKEIENAFEQAGKINYSFRERRMIAALQCADLVAWTNYHYSLQKFKGTPPSPFAEIAWNDFARKPCRPAPADVDDVMEWNFSVSIKRDRLKFWVEKETTTPDVMIKFKEWESQKEGRSVKVQREERKQSK